MQQSTVHDLKTLFKQPTRHAHQANSESFYNDNDNNGVIEEDDNGLGDFIAHMSISDETMSNEQTLHAYAAFQQNCGQICPRDPAAEINQPLYGKLTRELCMAWSREPNDIKKQIPKQNSQPPKQVYFINMLMYLNKNSPFI